MTIVHLKPEDFASPTWKRLTAELNARLSLLRERNDAHLDLQLTSSIRGSIAEVKHWLGLAEEVSPSPRVIPEYTLGDDNQWSDDP